MLKSEALHSPQGSREEIASVVHTQNPQMGPISIVFSCPSIVEDHEYS